MSNKRRSFAVIGLGAFGSSVATELVRLDGYVLGIDVDERRVARLADDLSEAKILDGSDEDALREAGLDRFGAVVVAIGEDVEASILSTMNARMLGCETIWVKAKDRTHHRILTKLGVERVLLPEQDYARHVAQMLHNPAVRDYVSLGNGFLVVTINVPEALEGKSLDALKLGDKFDLRPLGVMRGTEFHGAEQSAFKLEEDDRLLILGKRADQQRFGDSL